MTASRWFKVSDWTGARDGRAYPPEWIEERWRPLAAVLDIIRDAVGAPITLTANGGYSTRPTDTSQHPQGRAADIRCRRMPAGQLHGLILRLYREGAIPGLSGLALYQTFVHVDVGGPRRRDGSPRRWGLARRA